MGVDASQRLHVVRNLVRLDGRADAVGLGAGYHEDIRDHQPVPVQTQPVGLGPPEEPHVLVRVRLLGGLDGELEGLLGDAEDLARAKQRVEQPHIPTCGLAVAKRSDARVPTERRHAPGVDRDRIRRNDPVEPGSHYVFVGLGRTDRRTPDVIESVPK